MVSQSGVPENTVCHAHCMKPDAVYNDGWQEPLKSEATTSRSLSSGWSSSHIIKSSRTWAKTPSYTLNKCISNSGSGDMSFIFIYVSGMTTHLNSHVTVLSLHYLQRSQLLQTVVQTEASVEKLSIRFGLKTAKLWIHCREVCPALQAQTVYGRGFGAALFKSVLASVSSSLSSRAPLSGAVRRFTLGSRQTPLNMSNTRSKSWACHLYWCRLFIPRV